MPLLKLEANPASDRSAAALPRGIFAPMQLLITTPATNVGHSCDWRLAASR
jgi:hypothetical protein